ncbi:hypothetical protein K1719_039793 [Acacia pycnantha]|nr:hypothetical protein K1719_039793 [Acacia pycnantha]
MMISRHLFGWSPPHILITHVGVGGHQVEVEEEMEEPEEIEPTQAAGPFSRLFVCPDRLDWTLMVVGSLAAAAHGTALLGFKGDVWLAVKKIDHHHYKIYSHIYSSSVRGDGGVVVARRWIKRQKSLATEKEEGGDGIKEVMIDGLKS